MTKSGIRKAIKKYCSECMGNQPRLVKTCHITDCPLWPYRLGGVIKDVPKREKVEYSNDIHEEYQSK